MHLQKCNILCVFLRVAYVFVVIYSLSVFIVNYSDDTCFLLVRKFITTRNVDEFSGTSQLLERVPMRVGICWTLKTETILKMGSLWIWTPISRNVDLYLLPYLSDYSGCVCGWEFVLLRPRWWIQLTTSGVAVLIYKYLCVAFWTSILTKVHLNHIIIKNSYFLISILTLVK